MHTNTTVVTKTTYTVEMLQKKLYICNIYFSFYVRNIVIHKPSFANFVQTFNQIDLLLFQDYMFIHPNKLPRLMGGKGEIYCLFILLIIYLKNSLMEQ